MPKRKTTEVSLGGSPYKDYKRPYPQEIYKAVAALSQLHGKPTRGSSTTTVLDSLVRTILSQNTTDKNSRVAFSQLKKSFPTWSSVLQAPSDDVIESIRFGGLAEIKTERIKNILQTILHEYGDKSTKKGEPCLEFLRDLPTDRVKEILLKFPGVGPKTVACVLMFNMDRAEFPVDTHVWHVAKKMGWCPPHATRETCYEHLNVRVPDDCKYDLHVLLVEHGKRCKLCSKGGRLQKEEEGSCPLFKWNPHDGNDITTSTTTTTTMMMMMETASDSKMLNSNQNNFDQFKAKESPSKKIKVKVEKMEKKVDTAIVSGHAQSMRKLIHCDLQSGGIAESKEDNE